MAKKKLPNKKTRIFNLLKPYKPPPTAWDKIYEWLVTRARAIMVIAELLVVISFVGKIVVDVQAKNLDDQIIAGQGTLGRLSVSVEPTIRKIQQKSEAYLNIWNASSGYADILDEIHTYVANPSEDIVVRIQGNSVTIRGGSTIDELKVIEQRMRNSGTFTDVTIPTLNAEGSDISSGQAQYVFNARIAVDAVRDSIN